MADTRNFTVTGMHCAGCAAAVERAVGKISGVSSVSVNFAASRLSLVADSTAVTDEMVLDTVKRAGFSAEVIAPDTVKPPTEPDSGVTVTRFVIAVIFTLLLMAVMWFPPSLAAFHLRWLKFILLLPVLVAGRDYFINGAKSLSRGVPEMSALIFCSVTGAVLYSVPFLWLRELSGADYFGTAAMVVALVMFGKRLEARSRRRANQAVRELLALTPDQAVARDSDGVERTIPAAELRVGDVFVVKPGMSVPADGKVIKGGSAVNEALLTGESVPVPKVVGSPVIGGSVNCDGALVCVVTATAANGTLARMAELVENAQGSKAPSAKLADKVAGIFVWLVLSLAVITFAVWALRGASAGVALNFALCVLTISCPCALGLATPIAVIAGVGRGSRCGLLIKSGAALEAAALADTVVFDKTGTLTSGENIVTEQKCRGDADAALQLAFSLEKMSSHPLARALCDFAAKRGAAPLAITDFVEHPGLGVSGVVNETQILCGSGKFLRDHQVKIPPEWKNDGNSMIFLAVKRECVAMWSVSDTTRPEAIAAVAELRALGMSLAVLSGDNPEAVAAVAEPLQISVFHGGLLPAEKVAIIKTMQVADQKVLMVGDGVNDAPALAFADVGVALGTGTEISLESAGVVIPAGDLRFLAKLLVLCRATRRVMKQNLFWAFAYNLLAIPIAAGVFSAQGLILTPQIGAVAMAVSSLCVVTNALRLFKLKL